MFYRGADRGEVGCGRRPRWGAVAGRAGVCTSGVDPHACWMRFGGVARRGCVTCGGVPALVHPGPPVRGRVASPARVVAGDGDLRACRGWVDIRF